MTLLFLILKSLWVRVPKQCALLYYIIMKYTDLPGWGKWGNVWLCNLVALGEVFGEPQCMTFVAINLKRAFYYLQIVRFLLFLIMRSYTRHFHSSTESVLSGFLAMPCYLSILFLLLPTAYLFPCPPQSFLSTFRSPIQNDFTDI